MEYDVRNRKRNLLIAQIFSWLFGIATLVGIAIIIEYRNNDFIWVLLWFSIITLILPHALSMMICRKIRNELRTIEFLDRVVERTLFDELLTLYVEKKLVPKLKKYGFQLYIYATNNHSPRIIFRSIKMKRLLNIEFNHTGLRYYVAQRDTEEQDIEAQDWISVLYVDIKQACDINDLLSFLSSIKRD